MGPFASKGIFRHDAPESLADESTRPTKDGRVLVAQLLRLPFQLSHFTRGSLGFAKDMIKSLINLLVVFLFKIATLSFDDPLGSEVEACESAASQVFQAVLHFFQVC